MNLGLRETSTPAWEAATFLAGLESHRFCLYASLHSCLNCAYRQDLPLAPTRLLRAGVQVLKPGRSLPLSLDYRLKPTLPTQARYPSQQHFRRPY